MAKRCPDIAAGADKVIGGRTAKRRVIVNFHGVGQPVRSLEPGEEHVWISPSEMNAMLDLIADRDDVDITCDDGNASDFDLLMPALLERGMRATFFLLAGRIGESGSVGLGEIRALVSAGMTIGLHGWAHVSWRRLDHSSRTRELQDARNRLEDISGTSIQTAACPFGDYGRSTIKAIRSLGFSRVYTSDGGWFHVDQFVVPRNSVGNGPRNIGLAELDRLLGSPTIGIQASAKRWLKCIR